MSSAATMRVAGGTTGRKRISGSYFSSSFCVASGSSSSASSVAETPGDPAFEVPDLDLDVMTASGPEEGPLSSRASVSGIERRLLQQADFAIELLGARMKWN